MVQPPTPPPNPKPLPPLHAAHRCAALPGVLGHPPVHSSQRWCPWAPGGSGGDLHQGDRLSASPQHSWVQQAAGLEHVVRAPCAPHACSMHTPHACSMHSHHACAVHTPCTHCAHSMHAPHTLLCASACHQSSHNSSPSFANAANTPCCTYQFGLVLAGRQAGGGGTQCQCGTAEFPREFPTPTPSPGAPSTGSHHPAALPALQCLISPAAQRCVLTPSHSLPSPVAAAQ